MPAALKDRVVNLEVTLNRFIQHTDKALSDLSNEMKDFKNEMKDFKNESGKMLKEMNRQWGDLSNKLGTLVEDFVIPNIPTIFKQLTGVEELDLIAPRIRVRNSKKPVVRKEFDAMATGGNFILINETKSKPNSEKINDFADSLKEVFDFFPEHKNKKLLPVFSSLYIPEELVTMLTKHKIFALGMKEDTMQILNADLEL